MATIGKRPLRFNRLVMGRRLIAGELLEAFLVSGVAAVLGIRLYLELTGYPQVGGGTLHVAHMLWGGLLMMVALVILLGFLNTRALRIAAIVGGVGFGTFIDEVGKFVTNDNDYFFQPTAALIYVVFVLMYLAFRAIISRSEMTYQEKLANVMHITGDAVFPDLDAQQKHRALRLLEGGDGANATVEAMRSMIESMDASVIEKSPGPYARTKSGLNRLYQRLLARPWFSRVILGLFIFVSIMNLLESMAVIFSRELRVLLDTGTGVGAATLSYWEIGAWTFPIISGALVVTGVWRFRRSRMEAYRLFQSALLINIFLTQVFAFYTNQFAAVSGLTVNILMLLGVRYMIAQETA